MGVNLKIRASRSSEEKFEYTDDQDERKRHSTNKHNGKAKQQNKNIRHHHMKKKARNCAAIKTKHYFYKKIRLKIFTKWE
jgi:hypothetical protein